MRARSFPVLLLSASLSSWANDNGPGPFDEISLNRGCSLENVYRYDCMGEKILQGNDEYHFLNEHYRNYLKDSELSFDELHALQALVPSGLIVNVSRIDQHRDYLVGALAYSSGFVFNQTLGVMIERIPNPLGKAVGKSTQTLFKQIFPEISSGDLWTHYAYRTIRENSKLAFAQAIQLYSTGEILQRSPTVRKFVYNSMLKNLETHWSKYSSKEKDAYFLSMFVLTEKRFEMVEKDVTILQKWQDETTDTPPSIPDAEALAHIAANTTNSFQTSFNNIDIPSLNLGIDYDAVSNIYLNALETSEKERLEVDAQDLSLDEKLAAYQAIYAKVEAQLQTIEADINGVASFIGLFDPQASKALTTSFESVSLVTKGVTAVLNGVTVGSVLGGIGSIGAGLQLAQSILGSQRPNNDAIILSALKAISNQIQNLQLYVEANFHRTRASFSDVQSKLNLIHSTMLAEFFSVKKDINDVKRAVKKINDKIVRQTDLYKQLAREDLDLSFKNASADLTQKIIYQNQELRSAELSSLIDRFYDVVFSYSRTAWAGADNAFYGKHNSILETDYIASEILSSNYTENPLDYYIASGSGLYGTLNLSSFSPPNPSQWAEANRLISFLILLAKSEEFADIQDTDSPLNAALIASLERSTGYGLSVMDFSFSLQRDPVFFDDLFKLYRDAFSNLVKNAAIELQHSYTTSYQQGGLINTNALEKIYQPMLLNQRSKYLDEAAPAEAIERIKRQVAAVMPGDFSNGYSYSVSSGQHDVDGLPKLRDEENLPVILWPSYDLNEIIATDSQQVVPSYALALARADLAEYYQKYRLSQTGNQLIITHSAILVDKLSGRKFNLVEIDVNYSCPGASIKDYASPGLLLDASDDAIVARYHHPIVNGVCKVYKRVTDIRRIDDDLVSDVFAPILQDSLKRNALHVLSDSTSVENFNKIARLVHYLLLWAFPESARTGKDIILPVVDSSAHPLPEYNRVAQDAVADLFSHIGLSRFNFAPRTSEESLSPFLYEIENALNNRKLDLTGFDGYRQTVIDKIAFNQEATRKIILESEYVGHVYRFFHQLIKFGLEVDPRIEPIIYFNWSYLDYENKYGEQGEVACEGGVKVGEVKFDEIDNGKVERQCLQNGSFSVSAIHCVTPFVSNGSLDNPTCVSVLCENGREYQETWSKAINGGKHWYQCGAWGETQDLGIKCDNLKYDLDLATNRCVEKSCNARPHGAVWRELIDHGEINYQCKFGVESSTGSCHTGFIWSLTNRNCDTRVSCGLGQHYGDSFTYSEVDQCIEKTYRKTCNASGAFDIRFVSQRTVCQIGGPTPLPGTGNPEF